MHLYFKAVKSYTGVIFHPDEEEREDPYRSNMFKRYAYYTMEDLAIVNDATGRYERCPMPKPFSIPGKIGWWMLYIWQTKIAKTHI